MGPEGIVAVSGDAGPVGTYLAELTIPMDACENTQDAALAAVEQRLLEAIADVRALRLEIGKSKGGE